MTKRVSSFVWKSPEGVLNFTTIVHYADDPKDAVLDILTNFKRGPVVAVTSLTMDEYIKQFVSIVSAAEPPPDTRPSIN